MDSNRMRANGSRGAAPVKKLTISFAVPPKLPDNYEESLWLKLREAVQAIYASQPSRSLEELYKNVEDLCTQKFSKPLYDRLSNECREHVVQILQSIVTLQSDTLNPAAFLSAVDDHWQRYCSQTIVIRNVFLYLDRTYVQQNPSIVSLWDMGMFTWRDTILANLPVRQRLLDSILQLVEIERRGDVVDRSLLKSLLSMLSLLNVYNDIFLQPFLTASGLFYEREAQDAFESLKTPEYLIHVEGRLKAEIDRVQAYLHSSTRMPLLQLVEQHLIKSKVAYILERGFDELMHDKRVSDLSRMYQLFHRVGALDELKTCMVDYIKKNGNAIVSDPERDATMVQELLDFKSALDSLLEQAFASNEKFVHAIKDAFESFINTRQNKPAELIAKYVDSKLRTGNKDASEQALETMLENAMILFRFIHGKDVFEAFYKNDLAKRLLYGKSASVDAERLMLSKLKQECGSGFTSKLEGMFKDINVSKDLMQSFYNTSRMIEHLEPIELHVNVLTQGFWPTYPVVTVNLPDYMVAYQEAFRAFYAKTHGGRKLTWQNSLGECLLKAAFPKGMKELAVSMYQSLVLLQFNNNVEDHAPISLKDLQERTGIEINELKRTLQSLACGKVNTRVLLKNPKGKDVEDGDTFAMNTEFVNQHYKIKINQILLRETPEENTNTHEKVFQDRQYQVDAAIVRIMKMRKSLAHPLLIAELFQQLKFPVKPTDLKKRIESLIEREYLERDPDNTTVYRYLA